MNCFGISLSPVIHSFSSVSCPVLGAEGSERIEIAPALKSLQLAKSRDRWDVIGTTALSEAVDLGAVEWVLWEDFSQRISRSLRPGWCGSVD